MQPGSMEASGEHLGLVLGTFTLVLVSGSNPSAGFLRCLAVAEMIPGCLIYKSNKGSGPRRVSGPRR